MKKKYRVKITATAEMDVASIWGFISHDNPQNAALFIEELEEQIQSLAQFPERNPIIPESSILRTRMYRHLIYKHYRVVYRLDGRKVLILRVFHGSKLLDIASLT